MISKIINTDISILKSEKLDKLVYMYQKDKDALLAKVNLLYTTEIDRKKKASMQMSLISYEDALLAFTKINTVFFYKFSNEENYETKTKLNGYVQSSSIHISTLQNIYINPLIYNIQEIDNKNNSRKAIFSLYLAAVIAVLTTIFTFLLSNNTDKNIESAKEEIIPIIKEFKSMQDQYNFQMEVLIEKNKIVQQKLDSIYLKTGK